MFPIALDPLLPEMHRKQRAVPEQHFPTRRSRIGLISQLSVIRANAPSNSSTRADAASTPISPQEQKFSAKSQAT